MDGNLGMRAALSLALILGNAFFVATEYALVGARRSKAEALARAGNGSAKLLLKALDNLGQTVAGIQVAITMFGIGVGTLTEPFIARLLRSLFGSADPRVSIAVAFLLATYLLVVIGELVPKYMALVDPDRVALAVVRPLLFFVAVLKPLVWLASRSARLILLPFGINTEALKNESYGKGELLFMIRSGKDEGAIDKIQAEVVTRALRLDALTADDIMIHRLDIKWLDASLTKEQVLERVSQVPYNRLPVCRGDIDDVVGVVYLHDIVKHLNDEPFDLVSICRPAVVIPENLPLDKIVARMREEKIQILIVCDEYGGTSGLITLEDVVEEVFGEIEDQLEQERPPIETYPSGRISARGEVRLDELASYVGVEVHEGMSTDTLAEIIVNALERVPRIGDTVETELGTLRVENMARRRITRVALVQRPSG